MNIISKWIFSFSKAKLVPLSRRSLSNMHDSDFRSGVIAVVKEALNPFLFT